jgi:hypothetical protein
MNEKKTTDCEERDPKLTLEDALARIEKANNDAYSTLQITLQQQFESIISNLELKNNSEMERISIATQSMLKSDLSAKDISTLSLSVATMVEKINEHCSRVDIHGENNFHLIQELKDEFQSQKRWLLSILVTLVGALAGIVWELVSPLLK